MYQTGVLFLCANTQQYARVITVFVIAKTNIWSADFSWKTCIHFPQLNNPKRSWNSDILWLHFPASDVIEYSVNRITVYSQWRGEAVHIPTYKGSKEVMCGCMNTPVTAVEYRVACPSIDTAHSVCTGCKYCAAILTWHSLPLCF